MKKLRGKGFKRIRPEVIGAFIECGLLIGMNITAIAQTADGNNGINQANTMVRGSKGTITNFGVTPIH